jgi:hypothetical protein
MLLMWQSPLVNLEFISHKIEGRVILSPVRNLSHQI